MAEQLVPNSHKYKEEQKQKQEREKVEKVVTGKARRKKKSELSKVGDVFVSEDVKNVKDHVLFDVLVPAIKKALADVVTDGINMILFGDTGRGKSRSGSSYIAYDRRYDDSSYRRPQSRRPAGYDFDDVILDTRGEADDVLDRMREILERYGIVRVADFYELVGFDSDYTDNKYGWTSLRTADVIRGRDGYVLKLPKASPID